MGMIAVKADEWVEIAPGLSIPKAPSYFQRNQLTAWNNYFIGRAKLYNWSKTQQWKPEAGKIVAAMDIETDDPYINTFGPGAIRGLGEILTVGIYCPALNIAECVRYDNPIVKRLIEDPQVTLIFHNAVYDLDWLCNWSKTGYAIRARVEDTMTREALIDTYSPSFKLDYCCKKYGLEGKNKGDTIDSWWAVNGATICAKHGIKTKKTTAVAHLKYVPLEIVNRYCLQDCKATYDLFCAQQPCIEAEELERANDIECRLYPWLEATRKVGLYLDCNKREQLSNEVGAKLEAYKRDFRTKYGDVNVSSNKQLQSLWQKLGLPFEYDKKTGSISFGYDQMLEFLNGGDQLNMTDEQKQVAHSVAEDILKIREYDKLLNTFVDGQFVDLLYEGRLNTVLYPSKRDVSGGTVTGRFSCLAVGTPIWTEEYGYIPIEQCVAGLHIMTHEGTLRPIKQVRFTGYKPVGYIGDLLCTADHRIWTGSTFRRADCIEEVLYYDERWLNYKSRMERAGNSNVPCRRQTYYQGSCYQNGVLSQTREEMLVYVLASRCIRSREGSQILEVLGEEKRSRKSDVWAQGRTTSQLQRRVRRRKGSHYNGKRWEEMADSQISNGRHDWNSRGAVAKKSSSTSYRRKSEEQQSRQLSTMHKCWSRTPTQRLPIYRAWRAVAVLPVFDIEVDGVEHSFIAAGIPVHNSQNPNLQQVPAHGEWGKQCRSLFRPVTCEEARALGYEQDCDKWILGAFDYKQIEYRLFTHFAQGEEGKAAQKLYEEDPNLDYHEMGQKMMGWWYPDDEWANKEARHMMKRLSFGNLYGLKARTFSEHFKWDLLKSHPNVRQCDLLQLAKDLQTEYQTKVPFIKVTNDAIMKVGQKRGYVKTLSGKRQRMPPNPSKGGDDAYKLINYLVQGSAGDVFKKGVCVDAWEAGVFRVLIPHVMVHDEMVFSIPNNKAGYEACLKLKECMANAYPLKVQLGVDMEIGEDWGHCNGKGWKEFEEHWK